MRVTGVFVEMNDGDVIGVLSDFLDLIFEVEVGQLSDITFFKVINRFSWGCLKD